MQLEDRSRRLCEKLQRELGRTVDEALRDPEVIEVVLNPDGRLWAERLGGTMQPIGEMSASNAESLMATVASAMETTVTRENPIIEGELPTDGSRFEGLLPPVVSSPAFAIRKRASRLFTLDDYVARGIMTADQQKEIVSAVAERRNVLVVGGTGTGKTTLTNGIIQTIADVSPQHRLVILEDTVEIQCRSANVVQLRTSDTVTMQQLLRATMRLRPDRIIVGEVRGAEALALLKAWNTGHPGGVATVHANGAEAGLLRLEQLVEEGLQGGRANAAVVAQAVGLVVVIEKTAAAPGRRISQLVQVSGHRNGHYEFSSNASASTHEIDHHPE
jgi:type IV secretion system protein VirB11